MSSHKARPISVSRMTGRDSIGCLTLVIGLLRYLRALEHWHLTCPPRLLLKISLRPIRVRHLLVGGERRGRPQNSDAF
jgi:hypothetical protein